MYRNAAGKTLVAVYNTAAQERISHLYTDGKQTASFPVPARRLVAWTDGNKTPLSPLETTLPSPSAPATAPPAGPPILTRIEVEPKDALMSDRATQRFAAKGVDQSGKPVPVTPT